MTLTAQTFSTFVGNSQRSIRKGHLMKAMAIATFMVALMPVVAANAVLINVPDFNYAPDGTTGNLFQQTDIKALNGNADILPTGTPKTAYFVTTFNFGEGSSANLRAQFLASNGAGRIGVEILNSGTAQTVGTGNPNRSSIDLAPGAATMAGRTVTILAKVDYNSNYSTLFGSSNASDDTLMNVWIDPDSSAVEGSGITAGDFYALWNSAAFPTWRNTIFNNSTPLNAEASSITNTVILTGDDATFANALRIAAPPSIPEPASLALCTVAGLAMLRRRRAV